MQASASSSNPDDPGATLARAQLRSRRGSEIGWKTGAPIGADCSPCWLVDKPELNSNADDGRYGTRGGRRSCNIGTYAGSVCNASRPQSEEKNWKIKSENELERRSKTKKQEFQAGGFSTLSFRR